MKENLTRRVISLKCKISTPPPPPFDQEMKNWGKQNFNIWKLAKKYLEQITKPETQILKRGLHSGTFIFKLLMSRDGWASFLKQIWLYDELWNLTSAMKTSDFFFRFKATKMFKISIESNLIEIFYNRKISS